ncbi:UvrD-helicase domain-containing protein [Streptomyces sp. Tu102]|uniref:UvrD-helicase domain-containing protein n=1 Tax=Streptomyces TaxID=1883 RepID=UPI001BDD121E|nr:UvrD-helicase domain-containing protein [Streptomyces sp. Tu102]MBT1098083.1 UvrD-helicase domain-containing protein [Streptomyces sp. Tu102]
MTLTDTTGGLTSEQLIAAGTPRQRLYIEAAPGSGKTTVAAQRFGIQRFHRNNDPRAVIAVSFTRSATAELRDRVLSQWGTAALAWPHRIVTLDTIVCDLLVHLLDTEHVRWPAGHRQLTVVDHWRVCLNTSWTRHEPLVVLDGQHVVTRTATRARNESRPTTAAVDQALAQGLCTHQDTRRLLEMALSDPAIHDVLRAHLANTTRALIVDEIFDANALDLSLVRLAASAGLDVTVVGDPWQALYGFRGAQPDQVPTLVTQAGFARRDLHISFRWKSARQQLLADQLRQGHGITLPPGHAADTDVLLALQWSLLWDADRHVLPLAYSSSTGQPQEAACTLLLSELTQRSFGDNAVFHNDALTTLGIDQEALQRLQPRLSSLLEDLAGDKELAEILTGLNTAIREETNRTLPRRHPTHIARLNLLRTRLQAQTHPLVPGLTAHQAKGREWDHVGVRLTASERETLRQGLSPDNEDHRKLYVALTRARQTTVGMQGGTS